ncbi:MAG: TonB-dependent receptor [Gammaproteobacteria bacterium]|nr:TonB-dependent receptor [Gammaproteobacteria bacterium]
MTAQRRAERLQDVPIAVSAFTSSELEVRNVTQALDLIQYVPNMNGNNNTGLGSANVYFLRGLGNTDSIATFDPPVGTYIDDIYIARQNSNNFGLFEVERIEVLRGPQGTLFGRNTTGGAINLLLRKPGDVMRGTAEVGFGSFGEKRVRASIDLPVNDILSTQIAGYYVKSDGYIDNLTTGDEDNGKDEAGLRAAFQLKLGSSATWNAAVNYLYSGTLNKLGFECGTVAAAGTPSGGCSGRYANSAVPNDNPALTNLNVTIPNPAGAGTVDVATTLANGKGARDSGIDTNTLVVSSNLQVDINERNTLNFITGFVHLQQDYLYDFSEGRQGRSIGGQPVSGLPTAPLLQRPLILADAAGVLSPNGAFALAQKALGDQFSQEIKLSGETESGFLKYIGGVYYFREDNTTDLGDIGSSFVSGAATLAAQVPRPYITRVSADRVIENSTQSWAVYLQGDMKFSEQFTGTVGVRYTNETKTVGVTDLRDVRAVPIVGGVQRPDLRLETANLQRLGIPTRINTSLATPRFALNYTPADDILLFASATKGFRSGGWNVRGTTAQLFTPFLPEKVWTYEAGAKTEWLDSRLRANLTIFQLNDEKYQSPSAFVDALGLVQFITRNDADFKNRGVELELQAVPVSGLQLYMSAGYQDAKYENVAANTLDQQTQCLALRASNSVFSSRCAAGIVTAQGEIAEPVRVPEWTFAAGGSYDINLSDSLVLTPGVNVVYQSDTETAASNLTFYIDSAGVYNIDGVGKYVAGSLQKAYTLVNASLSLSGRDSKWKVIVDCSNCTDETYTQSAISGYSFLNPPRTYSARVQMSF